MKDDSERDNPSDTEFSKALEGIAREFGYEVPESPSNDSFDKAFAREMRQQEVSANVFRIRLKVLHKLVNEAVMCAGVTDMRAVYSREVQDVLLELLDIVREPKAKQTDIMLAAQVAIMVAWRLTNAAETAAFRQFDPSSEEGPDDPLYL